MEARVDILNKFFTEWDAAMDAAFKQSFTKLLKYKTVIIIMISAVEIMKQLHT